MHGDACVERRDSKRIQAMHGNRHGEGDGDPTRPTMERCDPAAALNGIPAEQPSPVTSCRHAKAKAAVVSADLAARPLEKPARLIA